MPTYAYRCPSCGHQFEKFHKMTVTDLPSCPKCGTAAERVITGGAGLVFKGSGFYVTDYKKSAPEGGEGAKKPATDAAAKPKHSTADKKPPSPKPEKPGD